MSNRERKLEFIDSYDENDSFDGDYSKLSAVPLTTHQVNLVNRILLQEKIKLTVVWIIYTIIVIVLAIYAPVEDLLQIVLLALFVVGDVIWMVHILKQWIKGKCNSNSRAYKGVVINRFYMRNKSERKYFVSIKLSNDDIIYKAKLSGSVKKSIDINDSVLIVPLISVVIIPYE